jgi:hypothetical protein
MCVGVEPIVFLLSEGERDGVCVTVSYEDVELLALGDNDNVNVVRNLDVRLYDYHYRSVEVDEAGRVVNENIIG